MEDLVKKLGFESVEEFHKLNAKIQTKEVAIRDINDILEAISRIERQVELLKKGKTEVGDTGVKRIDVIKEKALLIRSVVKRM